MPWIEAAPAEDLPAGGIRELTVGDRDLVVWRTASGRPVVMDARCPHQWSHLGVEGVVDGDEIVCGAHFWRFDCAGRGSKLAMNGRRDEKAAIAVFPCRVLDGMIEADVPGGDTGGGGSPPGEPRA